MEKHLPRVSIITPSFNQGQFLEDTIRSVVNQNYSNVEYIIIDGGSKDNSVAVIEKYSDRIFYWISEADEGQADAINKGFKKATGDYLCWVNSDDILYPDFISRRMKEFLENPKAGMIYGDVDQGWDLKNKVLRKGKQQTYTEMLKTSYVRVPQMSAMWSRAAVENTGFLQQNLHVLLDWEYILRTAKNNHILYIPGSVAFFRQHQHSKSVKHNLTWASEIEMFYADIFATERFGDFFRRLSNVNMYFYCASIFKEDGDRLQEEVYLAKAKSANWLLYLSKKATKDIIQFLVNTKKTLLHGGN